jgi:hypothetical protein
MARSPTTHKSTPTSCHTPVLAKPMVRAYFSNDLSIRSPKQIRAAFAARIGGGNPYVLLPAPAKDLADALLGETEGGSQAHNRFAPLVASPDPFIAVMLSRRVVGEGHRRRFLTEIHEQRPVVDRVHKMLESPDA